MTELEEDLGIDLLLWFDDEPKGIDATPRSLSDLLRCSRLPELPSFLLLADELLAGRADPALVGLDDRRLPTLRLLLTLDSSPLLVPPSLLLRCDELSPERRDPTTDDDRFMWSRCLTEETEDDRRPRAETDLDRGRDLSGVRVSSRPCRSAGGRFSGLLRGGLVCA
jgi:hypothetical protein